MTPENAGREIEAKFYTASHERIRRRLEEMGARLRDPRSLEVNYRFDDPARSLRARKRVLRLRKDAGAWLTYKGPPDPGSGATDRDEFEVAVGDLAAARRILEALEFTQTATYEKYRTVFEADGCKVMLDELPYGNFLEIEGDTEASIRALAARLGLRWEAVLKISYLRLWERYCVGRSFDPSDLTFEALAGVTIRAEDLGVEDASG